MEPRTLVEIECPQCGSSAKARARQYINVQANPRGRKDLLAGKLNLYRCRGCGYSNALPVDVFYHDAEKEFCVQYVPQWLAEAQTKKLDHILTKARVQPGQRLLDIGCGWGALVLRAAEKFGARCVGITLSENQHALATERVKAAGLADRIEIRLQDYREVTDTFDRITSVGMCEHVGLKNLETYFRIIHDRLAPDGWVLNHNITSTDADNAETSHGGGDFIERYVFPHGELPHISTILSTMQEGGLEPVDAESLRRHYARTLGCWSDNFEAKADKLSAMVPQKTWRIWRMYLVGCQWAFENDEISVFQVLCRRAGQPAKSLPWSRRWMYEER